jgi:hypothetical protein
MDVSWRVRVMRLIGHHHPADWFEVEELLE